MGARYLLALAAACAAVDVAYFRDDPAAKTQLEVTEDGAAWLQSHDTTIEIFDSPKPVHVYRVVVTGVPTSTVTLYPAKLGGGLRFPGAAYIFSNATYNCSDATRSHVWLQLPRGRGLLPNGVHCAKRRWRHEVPALRRRD